MPTPVKIEIEVDADGAIKGVRTTGDTIVRLGKDVDGLSTKTLNFGRIVDNAIGGLATTAINTFTNAIAGAAGGIVRLGSEVQSSLSELEAITGITGADLERLGETAVRESMRTGVAATQQIEAFKLLASNIDIATIGGVAGLEKLGAEVVTLNQAAGIDLAQAANIVAGSINSFGLEADQSARVVNLLAAGSKFGAAEVGDLGASLKNAGASAAGANVPIEETVGALEVMSQNFLKGGEAGTGLRNVISILQTEAKKLADAGIKDVNIEGDGLATTLGKLTPLLDDAAGLSNIFGRENANAARILIANADAVEEMTNKVTGTNTAVEQAALRTDNFEGAMNRLLATIQGVGIGLFQEYSDELEGVIDFTISAINFLREHSDVIKTTGQVLGILVASIAAYNAVTKTQILVTKAAAIAQRVLNTAMKLNPVGLVIAGLTAVTLLFIKFRDKVADAAAVVVGFGISVLNSFKFVGDALGIEAVGKGVDFMVSKLEGLQDSLRGYADGVRESKEETDAFTSGGGDFGGAGAGADFATDKVDELTDAIDENTEAKKRNAEVPPPRPGVAVQGSATGDDTTLGSEPLDLGDPIPVGTTETLTGINILLADYNRQLEAASTQQARDEILLMIEALNELKTEMSSVGDTSVQVAEAEKRARTASLASTLASVQATKSAGESAKRAAIDQAKSVINAEIGKAVARAVASIPFPLNLILGAAAAAGIKGLIGSLIPGFQFGGIVGGSGGTDSQIIRATPGEFVVNPSATRANRSVLESINSTGSPGAMTANVHFTGTLVGDRDLIVASIDEFRTITFQTRGDA